jgi:hypothetical protein
LPVKNYPTTLDGRYFIVKGRLWRCSNPNLSPEERNLLVHQLMDARRAVKDAKATQSVEALKQARVQVHAVKVALGERGAVWWTDGSPDYNRFKVENTPYALA